MEKKESEKDIHLHMPCLRFQDFMATVSLLPITTPLVRILIHSSMGIRLGCERLDVLRLHEGIGNFYAH